MQREPPPFVWAAPDEKDILTCALIVACYFETYADTTYRELYHCAFHQYIQTTQAQHRCSAVRQTPLTPVASIMVSSYSLQNIPSSPRVSRFVRVYLHSLRALTVVGGLVIADVHTFRPLSTRQAHLLLNV